MSTDQHWLRDVIAALQIHAQVTVLHWLYPHVASPDELRQELAHYHLGTVFERNQFGKSVFDCVKCCAGGGCSCEDCLSSCMAGSC